MLAANAHLPAFASSSIRPAGSLHTPIASTSGSVHLTDATRSGLMSRQRCAARAGATVAVSVLNQPAPIGSRSYGVPAHQQVQQQPRRTLCQAQSGSNDSLEPGPDAQSMPSTASTSGSAPEAQDLSSSGPWTPEKLERLGQRFYDGDAEGMGALWLSEFEDDPEFLFDYVEDAYNEGFSDVISPITLLAREAGETPAVKLPGPVAQDAVGMGTWRLKGCVDPIIEFLVSRLEGAWRYILDDDLCLYPADKWKQQGWDFCDSVDPARELDGWAWSDVPFPESGEEGWPRLMLENRIYCSRVFRKLHVEVGFRQDGLQVLHVVLYPRYTYDLPILAGDIVVVDGRVTLAIVDACPVSANQSLPQHYLQAMSMLQERFLPDAVKARTIPEWGKRIFSPLCVCIAPKTQEDLVGFVKYMCGLHMAHLQLAQLSSPVSGVDARARAKRQELLEAHKRFVDNQLANKKTRRVLDVAFGEDWSEQYMTQVMFDYNPSYNPPYYDTSIEKLYDYFEHNPELGVLADEQMRLEAAADARRADGYLRTFSAGDEVSPERLEESLAHMFNTDANFAAAIRALMPNMDASQEQGLIGKTLAEQLQSIAGMEEGGQSVNVQAQLVPTTDATTPSKQ